MSERANFRGGRGRGDRGGRGGGDRGGRGGGHAGGERKKENILDLSKYMEKDIRVRFNGGREGTVFVLRVYGVEKELTEVFAVTGTLKGYDQLMNLVLDNVKEVTRGQCVEAELRKMICTDEYTDEEGNTSSRSLGLLVARGTLLVLISPLDGSEEIANPFVQADDDDDE